MRETDSIGFSTFPLPHLRDTREPSGFRSTPAPFHPRMERAGIPYDISDTSAITTLRDTLQQIDFFLPQATPSFTQDLAHLKSITDPLYLPPISTAYDSRRLLVLFNRVLESHNEKHAARLFVGTVLQLPTGQTRDDAVAIMLDDPVFRGKVEQSLSFDLEEVRRR